MSVAMWVGLECAVNRVKDQYLDQCEKNGHYTRPGDLEAFAALKAEKIRYPCLWEKVAPHAPTEFDWTWLDQQLGRMRELGLSPIAGLLHHGSGPKYTSLIDPEFPEKFAAYAGAFAERYPWIEDYTPIDEILTTARFSCLYGHWYPHLKNDKAFMRALFHQVKGTILAMEAIRKVNPRARLIAIDDLGRAQSTAKLEYQARFENERRWLGFDLLCGRMNESHPLFRKSIIKNGLTADEIAWLQEHPCKPDIIGLNHYLLSSRFLDHRLELYPSWSHGGNRRHSYADVGAVDVGQTEVPTPESLFLEAWHRYHIPLAITEVHIRGHREDQMRWLHEIWTAAQSLQKRGVDIRAITAWSLLGNYDWHKLCTVTENFYEPGVFDLRSDDQSVRPTALSQMVHALATRGEFSHPVLEQPGWWKTSRRVLFAPSEQNISSPLNPCSSRPVIITGASGTLGRAFARICALRNIPFRLLSRAEMDIADQASVMATLQALKPWAVVNTAGYVNVDQAEIENELCFRENVLGPVVLAEQCAALKIPFLTFSSDLVFDGSQTEAYVESNVVSPLNVYGRSKAESENRVLRAYPEALVVRTSSFFGPWDHFNFATKTLSDLSKSRPVYAAHDMRVSPTYVPDLVHSCLNLLLDGENGLLHLVNGGGVSWAEFAHIVVENAGRHRMKLDSSLIIERSTGELNLPAPRPRNSVLGSERVRMMPPLEEAVGRYLFDLEVRA